MGNKSTKLLLPLSVIYRLVTETRLALFESGVLKKITSEKPVISVGNITTGGTGKTPIVIWIARALADAGFKPCILSRGYGREDPRSRLLVSDSQTINSDARRAGDEPLLIAEALRGRAAVVCDPDRSAAAIWASHNLD